MAGILREELVQFRITPCGKINNSCATMRTVAAIAGWCHLVPVLGTGIRDADLYGLRAFHSSFITCRRIFIYRALAGLN